MPVVKTIYDDSGKLRVDIYRRDNGTFGFEAWRFSDEPLELSWIPDGRYSYAVCDSAERAESKARGRVAWLATMAQTPVSVRTEPDHVAAHKHSSSHRPEIESSELCGCFCCCATFPPSEINEWLGGEGPSRTGETAFCPRCGIDSVIGSASGYPITKEFLTTMRAHWF